MIYLCRSERGQVLPVTAIFLAAFMVLVMFLFNYAGLRAVADTAAVGALRGAGLAALQERNPGQPSWYVNPPAADSTARSYATENLLGNNGKGYGGYRSFFTNDLQATLLQGTSSLTADGLDVEIINPAARPDQSSTLYLNTAELSPVPCGGLGTYPQSVQSVLDSTPSGCVSQATIVLRLRLTVKQVTGPTMTMEKIVTVQAGTDV